MRRRAAQFGLFVILGAVVNLAVAWRCALWSRPTTITSEEQLFRLVVPFWRVSPADNEFYCSVLLQDGGESRGKWEFDAMAKVGFGLAERELSVYRAREPEPETSGRMCVFATTIAREVQAGWPCLSLRGLYQTAPFGRRQSLNHYAAMHLPSLPGFHGNNGRILPYAPMWPGFAFNTAIYAAILWLLFAAPFAIRKRRRIKRGLCVKCAYPISTSDVCTECGARVKDVAT